MLKKLLIGIFLGIFWFWLLYLYFLYTGDTSIIRDRIQTHQLYTVIFFVSLVLLYILKGDNKLFKFLIFVIIITNLYIIWDMFFRNNIGLNSEQFFTLFGLILGALAVSYIQHRIRYLLMIIIGISIVFVLLTWILPLYENIPNITEFIQWQKTKIIKQWTDNEGFLLIKDVLGTKNLVVNDINNNNIDLSNKTQISFVSKTKTWLEKIFIDLGNGSFININPQSAITLQKSWDQTIMEILQGDIQYYTPSELSWVLQIIGKYTGEKIQNIENTVRWTITHQFEQNKQSFFINELWGEMLLNPVINNIIKFFITTLSTIYPKKYQENLENYTTIQQYFGESIPETKTTTTTGESIKDILNDIMSQVKKWSEETTIIKKRLP